MKNVSLEIEFYSVGIDGSGVALTYARPGSEILVINKKIIDALQNDVKPAQIEYPLDQEGEIQEVFHSDQYLESLTEFSIAILPSISKLIQAKSLTYAPVSERSAIGASMKFRSEIPNRASNAFVLQPSPQSVCVPVGNRHICYENHMCHADSREQFQWEHVSNGRTNRFHIEAALILTLKEGA